MIDEKRKNLIFIVANAVLAVALMIYYFINNEPGFPYSLIPGYFFGVLGAAIAMYVIHPKVKASKNPKKIGKAFVILMLLFTLLLVVFIVIYKLRS